ncbi:MAG: sugar transferase [Verrucomicrobiota bacterium]|jgi:exopolysaccharide biosynthesis polyprenyl glycosylphosphotransferase
MLRRDRQMRAQVHQLVDAFLFAVGFWLVGVLRADPQIIEWLHLKTLPPNAFENVGWLYFLLIPGAPLVLELQGFYNRPLLCPHRLILWPLLKGCVLITVGLVFALYALHLNVPRWVVVWFGCLSFTLVCLKEEILRSVYKSKLAQSQYKRRFILVGASNEIARLRHELAKQADEGIEIVGEFNFIEAPLQQLIELLHEYSASGVIVSAKQAYFERVESVIKVCELEGVDAWLMADFFGTQIAHASLDELFGYPLLVFRSAPETSWQSLAKMLMDFFGALTLLLVAAVPMLFIALLIKLTSPGPAFFRQKRSGLNGAPFMLYKFRTMVTNAEQFKHELEAMNEMRGPVFKVTNDPRVTRIGKWLRRYSLDELPQLFNVLRGEMSLVGPRPLPVDEVKRFNDLAHRRRLSVKPGITCLWQISGRNQIADFKEWVRLDLEYIDNWSLWLDLKILLLTIPAVFAATGAK